MSRNIEEIITMVLLEYEGKQEEWGKRNIKRRGKRDRNSGKGKATEDKFKWSQANEWGSWIETTKNEEEFEETDEEICKIGKKKIAGSEMQQTIREEWEAEAREKEGKRETKEEIKEKPENNFINRKFVISKKI